MLTHRFNFLLFILLISSALFAQNAPSFEITSGKKDFYKLSDTIKLNATIFVDEKSCLDGMKNTKSFEKGVKIIAQSGWSSKGEGKWTNSYTVVIVGNKSGDCKLTIFRRTDKDNIQFPIDFKVERKSQ